MDAVFLITLKYIKPQFAINKYFSKHKEFLEKYAESGHFIYCGRRKLKSGEFILCNASSRQEVKQMISEDPFDQYQLAIYEIEEYDLMITNMMS